ncbi:MAG TPA: ABC transporter ATP-binding protein [Chloroflexota bacterium]|nr:ABC transporter ATP-binding protein [Chloroflexota bacterium]
MQVSTTEYAALLRRYLAPEAGRALLLAVLLLGGIGLQLLNPQIVRAFIDAIAAGQPADRLVSTALLFLAVALLHQGLSVWAAYVGEDVGWASTNRLRSDLARHCLDLDMAWHNDRTPGELIERIDGDVTALASFFSQLVIRVFGSLLLLVGAVVLLFREDWRVGLAMTAFALVAVGLLVRVRNVAVPAITAEREANARVFGFVEERLAGIDDIRSRGAGAHAMRGLYAVMRDLFHRSRRAWMLGALVEVAVILLFALGYVIALGLGAYLFLAGAVTLGTAYLFFQYTEMLRSPIEQLTREMKELQTATAGIVRIGQLFRTRAAIQDGPVERLPDGPLSVELERVSFHYAEGTTVLRDVSLYLAPGRVLGLLGRTGSGKTTISRLLFRLYEPGDGAVRVGGRDLREVRLAELRRRVGIVTQEVQLFNGTVRENVTFFDRSIPDHRLRALLAELGLLAWLETLPQGLDTPLQGGNAGLSAGEAQLLAVARAFLSDPGLVILDEPSSRLDPATERLIEGAMARLLAGRTAIVIAHRLATVQRADEILILEEGRVRERGERARLAADPRSRFSELLHVGMQEVMV